MSIPANIAEGFRKLGPADKARFLNTSEGSLDECRYYLILANDLHYMDNTTMWPIADEVSRLLQSYRSVIQSNM